MSQKLESYLKKKLKNLDLKEVADIILFGSALKGKESPEDIDICVVFKEKENVQFLNEISSKLKNINAHLSSLVVDNFFRKPHSLIKTILVEGRSIITGRKISENFGLSSAFLYSYNISKLKPSDKVRFVYLLKGRKGAKGIIQEFGGEWIADSCFIFPLKHDYEISSILKKWKIDYKKKEVLFH